jgi:hypothetical protein
MLNAGDRGLPIDVDATAGRRWLGPGLGNASPGFPVDHGVLGGGATPSTRQRTLSSSGGYRDG